MDDESSTAPRRPRILIVDDNVANLTVLGDLLEREFEVQIANTGQRALQLAAASPQPEAILLDVMMPDLDGYEVMLHLGANPRTLGIPVIFVSALDSAEDKRRARAIGAADYIAKPYLIDDVRLRVRRQIERREKRNARSPE